MMGIQMAFAYIGSTFTPPLFGFVAEHIGISLFPFFLLMLAFVLFFATETVSSKVFVHE
jgi:fucose permease